MREIKGDDVISSKIKIATIMCVVIVPLLICGVAIGITPSKNVFEIETMSDVSQELTSITEFEEIVSEITTEEKSKNIEETTIKTPVTTTKATTTTKLEPTSKAVATTKANKQTHNNTYLSDYEIDLLARVIYQEAGTCGEYCQWLVGSTALNLADERDGIESVAFDYDTFNVAHKLYRETPSNLSYSVARRLASGDRDYKVKAFRKNYYHSFGTPYKKVDIVYFSTY